MLGNGAKRKILMITNISGSQTGPKPFNLRSVMARSATIALIVLFGMTLLTNIATNHAVAGTTIKVGAYENYPKIFTDNTGKVSGIFPQILESIALAEGWSIDYVHGNWTHCLEMLENHDIDMMVDVAYSEERATKYAFNNEVVMSNWGIIYSRSGLTVDSILDLEGKKVGVMKGSIHTEGTTGIKYLVQSFNINCTFVEVENYTQVFELIDSGKVDVGVVNRIFGEAFQKDYNVRKTSVIFGPQELFFAFPKNATANAELIGKIDSDLKKMKDDPNSDYYRALEYYFVNNKPGDKEILPGWVVPFALGLTCIVLLLVIFSILLQWRVKVRTKELRQANLKLQKDIRKRKEVEKELKKHREHLEDLVKERTVELEAANKDMEAFSYSVSHDLRAPLRTVDGFSQAVLEDYSDKLDEQGKDYLHRMRAATQRMAQMIEDILRLAMATKTELKRERVELSMMAHDITSVLQMSQPGRQVQFVIEPGITADGDPHLLNIALENLLGNAWKFTGPHPSARIEFGKSETDGETVYYVRDDGVGFDMRYVDRLFTSFRRLHDASEFPGTGIGLVTVSRIVHRHDGRIWAEGQLQKGATFYFTLK